MKKSLLDSYQHGGWPEDNKGYRVKVGRYTYYIRLYPERNARGIVQEYVMDVGGRKRGCVSLRIPTIAYGLPGVMDVTSALLKYVKHDPKCAATSDRELTSGSGTKHMVKTALYFAKELCPNTNIQSYRFVDTSTKVCSDGALIDLAYFMIALYGKTYYEKYFHARLQHNEEHAHYRNAMQRLKEVPKTSIPFQIFVDSLSVSKEQADAIKPMYGVATSFTDFFNKIREKYPQRVCKLTEKWVKNFVIQWVFSGRDLIENKVWIIPANAVADIDVAEWEVMDVKSVEMRFLNQEQEGGGHYLGLWTPDKD